MRRDDQDHSNSQKTEFKLMIELLQHQENKSEGKYEDGLERTMMPDKTMIQGIRTHHEGQYDHAPFKKNIVYNIDPENG